MKKTVDLGGTIIRLDGDKFVNYKEFQSKHTFGLSCSTPLCKGGATKVSKSGLLFCSHCMEDLSKMKKVHFNGGLTGLIYLALVAALARRKAVQIEAAKLLKVSPRKMNYLVKQAEIKSKKWKVNAPKVGSNYTKDHKLRVIA